MKTSRRRAGDPQSQRTPLGLMLRRAASVMALALVASGACGESEPADVVFMAGFKPQANLPFVAAYVAQEKGYFAEQNLKVDIRHAASGEHLKLLMAGDVDFTTAAATSVIKRRSDPALPIVAIALFGQRGQQAYVALKSSGIADLKDWEGKTFGYKTSVPPDYVAMIKAGNVRRDTIKEVNAGFDPRILTEGRVDILAVFKSNEPHTIRGLGFELNTWDPADYGVPSLGLTYITRQDLADEKPDLVVGFLKATLRGLRFALDNREETVDIVLKFAPNENREHQRFMLDSEIDDAVSALTDENGLGWMEDAQWKALYDELVEHGDIATAFDYRTAFTDRFLRAVYDNGSAR